MKLFKYEVEINQYCEGEHHSGGDGPYEGYTESSYSNSFEKVSPAKGKDKYGDLSSTVEMKDGDKGYLVWIEYSSGSTFGRSSRGHTMALGLFKEKKHARELEEAINSFQKAKGQKDPYRFSFETSDGQAFTYGFAPWIDYFGGLDEVHVELVEMEA